MFELCGVVTAIGGKVNSTISDIMSCYCYIVGLSLLGLELVGGETMLIIRVSLVF